MYAGQWGGHSIQKSQTHISQCISLYSICVFFFFLLGTGAEETGEICKTGNVVPHT
jgi:hypothetical protein